MKQALLLFVAGILSGCACNDPASYQETFKTCLDANSPAGQEAIDSCVRAASIAAQVPCGMVGERMCKP